MNITDKSVQKMLELLKDSLKGDRELTGNYTMPYSDSNDDMVDYVIKFKVSRVTLWREKNTPNCNFEGTIYLKFDKIMVGFNSTNEWETARIYDLPSWVEDDVKSSVLEDVDIFEQVCLDIDYEK